MLIHISQTKHIRKMTNSPIPVNPEGGRLTGLRGRDSDIQGRSVP